MNTLEIIKFLVELLTSVATLVVVANKAYKEAIIIYQRIRYDKKLRGDIRNRIFLAFHDKDIEDNDLKILHKLYDYYDPHLHNMIRKEFELCISIFPKELRKKYKDIYKF